MKLYTTLEELLKGQDMNPQKTAENVLNDNPCDPITEVIVEAWRKAGGDEGKMDFEKYDLFLGYTIQMLETAKKRAIEIENDFTKKLL